MLRFEFPPGAALVALENANTWQTKRTQGCRRVRAELDRRVASLCLRFAFHAWGVSLSALELALSLKTVQGCGLST